MIGSALKKFATENGLKVSNGVAYGSLRGYAVTLSEGAGYKQFVFSADFSDPAGKVRFMDQIATISEATWQKTYSVRNIAVQPKGIRVLFNDTVGTMKKVQVFLDWFIPILEQCGADRADICTHCGAQTSSGRWYLINGVARYMHEACAQSVNRQIEQTNEEKKDAIAGSYITGAIGAVIGALVGSLAWAVLQMAGYFASIIGLAMGWLADKGLDFIQTDWTMMLRNYLLSANKYYREVPLPITKRGRKTSFLLWLSSPQETKTFLPSRKKSSTTFMS